MRRALDLFQQDSYYDDGSTSSSAQGTNYVPPPQPPGPVPASTISMTIPISVAGITSVSQNASSTPSSQNVYNTSYPGPSQSGRTPYREHQRLFGFNCRNAEQAGSSRQGLSSGRKRSSSTTDSLGKKKAALSSATWTRDCICLGYREQDWVPSLEEKMALASSGLGLKRLTFSQNGDDAHIWNVLKNAFPKLAEVSYELLRPNPHSKKLLVIAVPPNGFTIPYLKDVVGQAKLYVRPASKDLEVESKVCYMKHI